MSLKRQHNSEAKQGREYSLSTQDLFRLGTDRGTSTSTEGTSSRTDSTAVGSPGQSSVPSLGVGPGQDSSASTKNTSPRWFVSRLPAVLGDSHEVRLGSVTERRLRPVGGQGPVGILLIVERNTSLSVVLLERPLSIVRDNLADKSSSTTSANTGTNGVTDPRLRSFSVLVDGSSSRGGSRNRLCHSVGSSRSRSRNSLPVLVD